MWSALQLKNLSVQEVAAMPHKHRYLCPCCARGVGTWVAFYCCIHHSHPKSGSPEYQELYHYIEQQGWFLRRSARIEAWKEAQEA